MDFTEEVLPIHETVSTQEGLAVRDEQRLGLAVIARDLKREAQVLPKGVGISAHEGGEYGLKLPRILNRDGGKLLIHDHGISFQLGFLLLLPRVSAAFTALSRLFSCPSHQQDRNRP
jgi:hypothetical protein